MQIKVYEGSGPFQKEVKHTFLLLHAMNENLDVEKGESCFCQNNICRPKKGEVTFLVQTFRWCSLYAEEQGESNASLARTRHGRVEWAIVRDNCPICEQFLP